MLSRVSPAIAAVIVLGMATPAQAMIRPDTHCSKGQVAITFDDGPSKVNTPKLLKILRHEHAQATFFVQGQNVTRYPSIVRAAVRDGHAVEDHSWDHPDLTTRSNRSVKRQLGLTKYAIRKATGRTPILFRPPYGATSKRVRHIATKTHLRQKLWTIDTRDWSGISTKQIRAAALKGLRPHHSNVILMHDAVLNSPRTFKAVPAIVDGLRRKGYCLVPLQKMMPLGIVSARPVTVSEGNAAATLVPIRLSLDGPSQRRGRMRVQTVAGTATAGSDFDAVDRTVTFLRGSRSKTIHVRIHGDSMSGSAKTFTVKLSHPHGLHLATKTIRVTITDNGQWLIDGAIATPTIGPSSTLAP